MKIDKDVPLPPWHKARKYPLAELAVGESFVIDRNDRDKVAGAFARHAPKRFARRTVIENGAEVVRVWRVV